jgi:L-serine deaminase
MAAVLVASAAYAANVTLTPIVPPTETGENSLSSQQVVDMARLKPGSCSATIAISTSAGSGTCNGAMGILSVTTATAGASGTSPSVITLNDSKVQVGDMVDCTPDQTGATSGAVLTCNAHVGSAGVITLSIYDGSATAMTSSSVTLEFMVFTQGNSN